ncbi:MAG TPA: metallophosphoesterase family protein [Thermomicrobiales bacterium]|nr:metallophosphoesterase family protein [Thermomicrobiales bacterium]
MPEFERFDVPLRIGVVSDTHLINAERGISDRVLKLLDGCDLIFHAGDINRQWVLDALQTVAPVRAVYGNNDPIELQLRLAIDRYFQIGPHRMGLIHGHTATHAKRMTARQRAQEGMHGVVDCVVYGHSHQPEIETRDGLLMVNPGSPTAPRWAPFPTLAIIEIGETIDARLIVV